MDFQTKLLRLIGSRDQSDVAANAGIPATTFSAYCTGKRRPSAELAVGLAKALDCDLLWLLDDSREWDDARGIQSINRVPDDALICEVRRRAIDAALHLRRELIQLANADCLRAVNALRARRDGLIPREAAEITMIIGQIFIQWDRLLNFTTMRWLPGNEVKTDISLPDGESPSDISIESLAAFELSIYQRSETLREFLRLMGRQFSGEPSRWAQDALAKHQGRLRQLAAREGNSRPRDDA